MKFPTNIVVTTSEPMKWSENDQPEKRERGLDDEENIKQIIILQVRSNVLLVPTYVRPRVTWPMACYC